METPAAKKPEAATANAPRSDPSEFAVKCLLIVCLFPFSLIYLALKDEENRRKIGQALMAAVSFIIAAVILVIALIVAYPWFPKTVTAIVAAIVVFFVASNLDNMEPKYSGSGSNKLLRDFAKLVVWTSAIVAGILLALNLANWIFKLAIWMSKAPFMMANALPTPLGHLIYVLIGAFLARKFLTKSRMIRGLELAEAALARARILLQES